MNLITVLTVPNSINVDMCTFVNMKSLLRSAFVLKGPSLLLYFKLVLAFYVKGPNPQWSVVGYTSIKQSNAKQVKKDLCLLLLT